MALRSDLDNKTQNDLLEEILMLSKRCITDDGVYLTDSGSELMKRIKIKPAPVRRARMTKSTIRSNSDVDGMEVDLKGSGSGPVDKDNEASGSSADEKMDESADAVGEAGGGQQAKGDAKKSGQLMPAVTKRTVLLGQKFFLTFCLVSFVNYRYLLEAELGNHLNLE